MRNRIPNIENIYIIECTQVSNAELARGCSLEPQRVYSIDKKYTSVEKLPSGDPVQFKITEKAGATLVLENKAVCVKKGPDGWEAVNIFGETIKDGPKIILKKDKKEAGKTE